ncbi:MAG: hypothetical protein ABSE42_02825 [Bryobacteraceae bacterium]|jgi:hypothetical protein
MSFGLRVFIVDATGLLKDGGQEPELYSAPAGNGPGSRQGRSGAGPNRFHGWHEQSNDTDTAEHQEGQDEGVFNHVLGLFSAPKLLQM